MNKASMALNDTKNISVWNIEQYMQDHLSHYLREVSDLCAIDSGTYDKVGVDRVALCLAERLRGLRMEVSLYEQEKWGNDVYAILHGSGQGKVTLLGHIDTVYPAGTAAARPVQVQGNKVLGPGVYDMKGCILSAVYAIEALQAQDYDDFGEIHLLCVTDEEISDRHSQGLIWQACQDSQEVLVLEGARENGDVVSARKGGACYTLSAYGHCAHAGVEPEKGCNAIVELAHQILQFQSLNGWREGVTINAGRICGGTATNVVPDYAQVSIDLRFLRHADRYGTEQRWHEMMQNKSIPGVQLTLEAAPSSKDPMSCTPQSLHLIHYAQQKDVLPSSTGVIGRQLPMEKIRQGIHGIAQEMRPGHLEQAALAIMTTDTHPKMHCSQIGNAVLVGIAKGVGMIEPNMATMLSYFVTDAKIAPDVLLQSLKEAVDLSFNMVSIDTDTSTSDTVAIMANGLAGEVDLGEFRCALQRMARELAKDLARDGEGATKLIEVSVDAAASFAQAKRVAKSILNSPLVKTAIFGADPNWGRIAMAVGKCEEQIAIVPEKVSIAFGNLVVYQGRSLGEENLTRLKAYLNNPEIVIHVSLGLGDSKATVWGCDLSPDYVSINAAYAT